MLGNFLLAFGSLDELISSFLRERLEPSEFSKLRGAGFKDRLNRMSEVIREAAATPKEIKRFKTLMRRVDMIRDLRNHVAHAHLFGTINPSTGKPEITLLTAKDADLGLLAESRHVTFLELAQTNNELHALLGDFEALTGYKLKVKTELP